MGLMIFGGTSLEEKPLSPLSLESQIGRESLSLQNYRQIRKISVLKLKLPDTYCGLLGLGWR